MRKINIGLFCDAFYPMIDGVISVVDNYARKLSKKANVVVFVPTYKNRFFDDNTLPYKVIRVKSITIPKLDYVLPVPKLDRKFIKDLEIYKLDIIHIHSPATIGMTALKYAKENNIPVISTLHSQYKQDFQNYTHSKILTKIATKKIVNIFNSCDECWAVNKGVSELFYYDYGLKRLPRVIVTASDMLPVKNIKKACKIINEKHHISPDEKVFLFVGRLYKLKNILFIVDALKELDKKVSFKYKMLYVGTGDGEELLRKHIRDNHLDDKIILCGRVDDRELLSYYYVRCDLFLFPSIYDTNSLVQKEAASQKKPTIFIENSITASDIINNETGFITKKNPKEYSDKIIEVLDDKQLYNKVANNAYKRVYCTWDDIVNESYNVYLEIIDKYQNR